MKKRKKERPYEIRRYRMGLQVTAGGISLPNAHVVYEVCYSDGSSRLERGKSVFGVAHTNLLTGITKNDITSRPDLNIIMHAAALLNSQIEEACLRADGHFDKGENKKKRYKDNY